MTGVSMYARTAVAVAAIAIGSHLHPGPQAAIHTVLSGPSPADAMPAAIEGYGAATRGGSGQPQCVVRSLADSGAATLRECLSHGNRYVTFAVAGTIALASQLHVQGSFVTIDGFSAPSPGITLRGWGLDIRDVHDVIVSGLRIRDAGGGYAGKSSTDCLLIYGTGAFNIVIDHVSIYNCADGGLDISTGPRDVTIQWSIVSAFKLALWGSTSSSSSSSTDRISVHHSMFVCGPEVVSGGTGCDRVPLVRASSAPLSLDLRRNILEGWIRANGTKIEPAAEVNVVDNAYIPRPDTTFAQRQDSIAVNPGTRVYTAGNIELGASPRPDLNINGNEARPFPAPPITARKLGCVVRDAGMHPRDAADRTLLTYVTQVPAGCDDEPLPPPPPAPSQYSDLVPRALGAPSSAAVGQTLSLSATVVNAGTAAAAASTARLYLSTDRSVSAGDIALGSIAMPTLAPAGAHSGTVTVTLAAGTAAGTYMLLVQADSGGAITESNEANNTLAIPLTVTTTPLSPFAALVQAESMTVASGMSVGVDAGALGGRYLSPTGGTSSTAPVREAWASVTVPAAGMYHLWARMYGPSAAADALYVGIGSSWIRAYPSSHRTYQWVRIASATAGFQLAAGTHAIQVGRGEVNARVDAVYLTSNASDVPKFVPAPPSASRIPVLVEAESMEITSGMSAHPDAGALGGQYLSPTSGMNSTAPGREASVSVSIPTAGTYYLWARMYGVSGTADALYVGIGSSWDRAYPSSHGVYQWVRIEVTNGSGAFGFQLAPGTHTIQVGRGELNTRLDALYLTDAATDVPTFGSQTASGQTLR